MLRILSAVLLAAFCIGRLSAQNQTSTVSPIYPETSLPFRISIEQDDFTLPNGVHSYASAIYKDNILIIAGRTNGLHGFGPPQTNFPPQEQNTTVYVIEPCSKRVWMKSLYDPSAGLTQDQIDSLSVTSPQSYQDKDKLYMTGGYGVITATGEFNTKNVLTAIDVPGLINWVKKPHKHETAADHIKQAFDPMFQVTGGYMGPGRHGRTLLIFGQNFQGFYAPGSNGNYTDQVRTFRIVDKKHEKLRFKSLNYPIPNPDFRRRDLNVVPIIQFTHNGLEKNYVAFSGVFTEEGGAWTIPVVIDSKGNASTDSAVDPTAFMQGMNNYVCPSIGLYASHKQEMYMILLGGISYGYFQNGAFQVDSELPFINQVTTIKMNHKGHFKQYLMDAQYPVILSTASNPGNPLLFGAGANFFPVSDLPTYKNGAFQLDRFKKKPVLLGYIIGGIQSTLPNTNTQSDSAASPYVFRVYLETSK